MDSGDMKNFNNGHPRADVVTNSLGFGFAIWAYAQNNSLVGLNEIYGTETRGAP